MKTPRVYPALKPYWNNDKEQWHVHVTWAANDYSRHSLGIKSESHVEVALELFRANKLPELQAKRAITPKDRERDPRKTEIERAVHWFINTNLKLLRREKNTVDIYSHILESFKNFAAAQKVTTGQQITTRLIQEWQIARRTERRTGDTQAGQRSELIILKKFFAEAKAASELKMLTFISITGPNGEKQQIPAIKWDIPRRPRSKRFQRIPDAVLSRVVNDLETDIATNSEDARLAMALLWMVGTPWLPSDTTDFRFHEDHGHEIDRDRIKTTREMCYPITPDLRRIIDLATAGRKMKPSDCIFVRSDLSEWTRNTFKKAFREWRAKHGYTFCFRDMRVTWASNMAPLCQPNELAELMGVEDVTTVYDFYDRVDITRMATAQKRHCARIAAIQSGEAPEADILPFIVPRKAGRK